MEVQMCKRMATHTHATKTCTNALFRRATGFLVCGVVSGDATPSTPAAVFVEKVAAAAPSLRWYAPTRKSTFCRRKEGKGGRKEREEGKREE
jgi:hypothetical protein